MPLTITHLLGTTTPTPPLTPLRMWGGNLLQESPPASARSPDQPLVCWSGWIESELQEAEEESGAAGLPDFRTQLRTWGPEAWDQMLRALQAAGQQDRPAPILLRPHARHVVSDAQRCVRFLEAIGASTPACGLLLDPAAMLTPDMLTDAAEHLDRMLAGLAAAVAAGIGASGNGAGGLWGLLLTGLEPGPQGELTACPLTRGVLPADILLAAAAGWTEAAGPRRVVILAEDAAGQIELVRRRGAGGTEG